MTNKSIAERFFGKVHKTDGCWLWIARCDKAGYGRFTMNGREESAHRSVWKLKHGDIPEGTCVLHRCDNPPCVRPDHLFLGTQKDNMEDCSNKNRFAQSRRTHCPQGHSYAGRNLILNAKGWRECRLCNNEKSRRYESRHK